MAEPVFGLCIPLGGGHAPVDPSYGRPGGGWSPADPGYGHGGGGNYPSGGPVPPPGVWGPPGGNLPAAPPGSIDNELPTVPGIPVYPAHPLPPSPGHPEGGPILPGTIWPPLPPQFGDGEVLALVVVFGVGYRWAVLDLGLKPGMPLPPTAEPK